MLQIIRAPLASLTGCRIPPQHSQRDAPFSGYHLSARAADAPADALHFTSFTSFTSITWAGDAPLWLLRYGNARYSSFMDERGCVLLPAAYAGRLFGATIGAARCPLP